MSSTLPIADSDETPEGVLGGHVHEEERGDGRHGLAVAVDGVQHGVGLEHAEQLGLADALVRAPEQLVRREVAVKVLLDVGQPALLPTRRLKCTEVLENNISQLFTSLIHRASVRNNILRYVQM